MSAEARRCSPTVRARHFQCSRAPDAHLAGCDCRGGHVRGGITFTGKCTAICPGGLRTGTRDPHQAQVQNQGRLCQDDGEQTRVIFVQVTNSGARPQGAQLRGRGAGAGAEEC